MAAVEPYSLCPCGSGQKYKWCCQKGEAYAERAQRLFEGGQAALAIQALDEGLGKDPQNAWLLTRKALYLVNRNEPEAAKEALRQVFPKQPKNLAAHFLIMQLVLETEGAVGGAAQLQQALTAFDRGERTVLVDLVRLVGSVLAEAAEFPAALKHLGLEQQLGPSPESKSESLLRMLQTSPGVSPWLKNPYRLAEPPGGLSADVHARFTEALRWAEAGLWSTAAAAFELLSTEETAGLEADHNLGLCRLWLADDAGAVEAFRRSIARRGATTEAVDLAALCQEIAPLGPDDQVEQVQWIWPLLDREGLLRTLRADPAVHEEQPGPIDPEDPGSPKVEQYGWFDRPMVEVRRGLNAREIPRSVGRVLVGQEIVALETFDDGRLDTLGERFTTLAGATIAPAHPKTKVLGTVAAAAVALMLERLLPEGMDRDEVSRLDRDMGVLAIREVWPNTPMPYLGGRTPLEAAAAGDAEVPLRAAVFQLELSREPWHDEIDFGAMRAMLKIGPEPDIDPETVDLQRIHLARLALVPVERLSDARLIEFYVRAKSMMQVQALERATRALIDRPSVTAKRGLESSVLYTDLVLLSSGRGRDDEAFDWLRRGRQADPPAARARLAPVWDMLEIRLKSRTQWPESWVPDLAIVIDRYRDHPASNQSIVMSLIDMGLIRVVPGKEGTDEVKVDSRPLQALLAEYGPRVTTASGQLGVSTTKGGIWTPGSATGGGGGAIWTPGSGSVSGAPADRTPPVPGGEKPRRIIPGR